MEHLGHKYSTMGRSSLFPFSALWQLILADNTSSTKIFECGREPTTPQNIHLMYVLVNRL